MNYPVLYDPNKNRYDQYGRSLVFLTIFIGAVFGYTVFCIHGGLFSDEGFHAPQIWTYYSGGTEFAESITVPPTYHYIMGFIVRQIGYYDDNLLKLISLLISLLTIPVFYKITYKYFPSEASIRTLQLFFLPLMFIYYFLIYTDIWALLFITLNLYLALNKQYVLSAFVGLFAICLRQDSVIWVGLSFLLICFEKENIKHAFSPVEILKNAFSKGFFYILIFIGFIAFVIYNGGVAIGDKDQHNSGLINFSNFYIFLILAWFLFLPLNIHLISQILTFLRNPWKAAAVIAGFLLYMGTLSNPHGYNNTLLDYFLHNGMASLLATNILIKSLSYFFSAWMLLSLIVMPLPEQRFKWILFVIPLAVMFHPMIEPRYYFPAYCVIHFLRPALAPKVEVGTLVFYVLGAAFILYGSVAGKFFL